VHCAINNALLLLLLLLLFIWRLLLFVYDEDAACMRVPCVLA
jgi:hypothetical protein